MTIQIFRFFSILCFWAFIGLATSALAGQSVWNHNGSQMLLQSNGNQRIITYLHPRRGISAQPGQVLFRGQRNGQYYSGTAYTFRRGCNPAPYHVSGRLSSEHRIVLRGAAPKRKGCRIVGYSKRSGSAKLVFSYLHKRYGGDDQDTEGSQPEGPQGGPVEKIIRFIPGGEIIFRVQDEDDPVFVPIRIDAHARCDSGQRVEVFNNYRTCAFDGLSTSKDGITLIMNLREYGGSSCSDPLVMRVQVHDLCR
jgi:hypothetical protein